MGERPSFFDRVPFYVYVFTWMFLILIVIFSIYVLILKYSAFPLFSRLLGLTGLALVGNWFISLLPGLSLRGRSFWLTQINLMLIGAVMYLGGPPFYPLLTCAAIQIVLQCSTGHPLDIGFSTFSAWLYATLAVGARQAWRFTPEEVLYPLVFAFILVLAMVVGLGVWRRERELHRQLTRTVEDLTKSRAEQEKQLDEMRRTHLLLEERYAETYALYLIQQELAAELEIEKILPKVADIVLGLLGGRTCAIIRADREERRFFQVAASGQVNGELVLPLGGDHLLARCWNENRVFSHADLKEEEWSFWRARGTNGLLCHPIVIKKERIGLLLVEYDYLPQSLEDHRDLLSLVAGQLSLALENASLYQKVRQMATHDALTGLANRHFFQEKLKEEMGLAGKDRPLSAVIVDLDHFKQVNDEYGHEAGDEVLRFTARLLGAEVGEEVTVARYGGEEFVLLLPDCSSDRAVAVAEAIRRRLKETPCRWEGREIRITASFGVATYPEQAADRQSLLRLADRALYEAKKERDRVVKATA